VRDLSFAAARIAGEVVPLVLAAGASSRMGRPKELLEFQGLSCLQVVLGVCEAAGLARPLVVTRKERLPLLQAHLAGRPGVAELLVNPAPERGQSSSFQVGLARLPVGRAFLLYPVDHPLVTAADVVRLIEAFVAPVTDGEPAVDLVAPSFNRRRGHPVLVSARLVPLLLALGPDDSPRTILSAPSTVTRHVELDDDRVLRDMDTPEAYAECLARYRPPVGRL
jgi:CTP:molybdopterin cytidylyltransferase MocA